jgi:hypothetical protein
MEHTCEVCFRPMAEHDEDEFWPGRCCHGCSCGVTRPDDTDDRGGEDE